MLVVPSHEAVAPWTGQSFVSSGTEPPRSWDGGWNATALVQSSTLHLRGLIRNRWKHLQTLMRIPSGSLGAV